MTWPADVMLQYKMAISSAVPGQCMSSAELEARSHGSKEPSPPAEGKDCCRLLFQMLHLSSTLGSCLKVLTVESTTLFSASLPTPNMRT